MSMLLRIPPETLELALDHLWRGELVRTLTVSAAFHHVAARVLYRELADVLPRQSVRLVRTLARNDVYPALVRRLDLEWTDNTLTANFLRLLHRALVRLVRLTHLGLDFSPSDTAAAAPSLAWVLRGCPFSLRVFTTSMRCDAALARFFATQPHIVEICLCSVPGTLDDGPASFHLPARALPRLTHFRMVHSSPALTAHFVRGRPVESVSVSLSPGDMSRSLDALLLSTRPLKRLTVLTVDIESPVSLVTDIAARLPMLEALHAVVLRRQSTYDQLLETAASLSGFRALRYLTFIAPGASADDPPGIEARIAAVWHEACPTLKTIILPKGVVWGLVDGQWTALQPEDDGHGTSLG